MCFGGGKSADKYYEEIKPEFDPLPSLSMTATKDQKAPKYGDVKRTGLSRRSLLNPNAGMTNGE